MDRWTGGGVWMAWKNGGNYCLRDGLTDSAAAIHGLASLVIIAYITTLYNNADGEVGLHKTRLSEEGR